MIPSQYIFDPIEVIIDTIAQFMHLSMIDYDMLPIHASVVCKGNKGIVILGNSGAGKTTLQMTLLQNGYSFFSDDGVFVTKDMEVYANMVKHVSYTIQTAQIANDLFGFHLDAAEKHKSRINMSLVNYCTKPCVLIFPEENTKDDTYKIEKISSKEVLLRLMQNHVSKEYLPEIKGKYWKLFADMSKRYEAFSLKWKREFTLSQYKQVIKTLVESVSNREKL